MPLPLMTSGYMFYFTRLAVGLNPHGEDRGFHGHVQGKWGELRQNRP